MFIFIYLAIDGSLINFFTQLIHSGYLLLNIYYVLETLFGTAGTECTEKTKILAFMKLISWPESQTINNINK